MKTLCIVLFLILSTVAGTLLNTQPSNNPDDRDALWKQVQQAQSKGLPKSAAKLLAQIYDSAVADEAFAEATKAICYQIRVEGQINQPAMPYSIRKLQAELPKLHPEVQPLANVIQAHWFLSYYYQNRWQIQQRSQTAQSPSDDFETWDSARLLEEVDKLLQASLANSDKLKKLPIAQFDKLLDKGTMPDTYQPTLYDFIAHHAAQFYSLDEQIVRAQDNFELTADSPIFADTKAFLEWQPNSESKSPTLRAISIYQDLLKFHADDEDPTAKLYADLQRIRLGARVGVGDDDGTRYRAALQRFADQNVKHEISAIALAFQAQSWQSKGDLVKAREVASVGMQRFPESLGGKRCFNLVQQVERPQLTLVAEQIWNGEQVEIQATHANLSEVHFRLIPFDYRNWKWGSRGEPQSLINRDNFQQYAQKKPAVSWSAELPAADDFKPRTDAVPANTDVAPGSYLLIASTDKEFGKNNNLLSATHVWVSDLNIVSRENGDTEGQVFDAIKGTPVSGAKVSVYRWKQDGRNSREELVGETTTDDRGIYKLAKRIGRNRGYRQMVYIQHADQAFGVNTYSYRNNRRNQSKTHQQTFFFTDRSIYRPGQIVKFKGICASFNRETNDYKTITDGENTVRLVDPNGQEIEKKSFRMNEFGSISGSFTVPRDRGTGKMSLEATRFGGGHTHFRVEEYKRPKFFVDVEKPAEQTRLEQPVNVTVKATGYTGAPVDGAKVVYRVVRNVQYPQWWYWRCWYLPPQNNSQEIANGKGVTSVEGDFTVEFPATPDRSVDRESQPVFVYTVYADVTDSAGETRSFSQAINIGYTALAATLKAKDWLTTEAPVEFKIGTETLDGEGQAATGKLTIYQLKNPDRVQRKKLLSYYRGQGVDQSDIKSWELGDSVKEIEVKTNDDGTAKQSAKLDAGAYKAVFETADDAGQKVTTEFPFQVVDIAADKMPVKIANLVQAEDWTVEPGEEFFALWATGYDTGRAFVEISHRGKTVESYWTDAERTQQPIKFMVEEKHRGGFQINVTYIRENRAYLTSRKVDVPWTNKDLKIKWEHFVSKLTPGGKETWTAVITGPDAKVTAAEMVAGMYDASLDAFAPHSWPNQIKNLFYQDRSQISLRYRNQSVYFRNVWNDISMPQKSEYATFRSFDRQIVGDALAWSNLWVDVQPARLGGEIFQGGRGMRRMSKKSQPMLMEMNVDSAVPATPAMEMAQSSPAADFAMDDIEGEGLSRADQSMDKDASGSGGNADGPNLDQVNARTNLQETAFFYPHLIADDNGTVKIEFTIPEALTKWKFLSFAHDTDLRTAMLTDEVTTSKDLMVQPNPPRFLREGDQLEFSVKITNRGDTPQVGSIRLTLADAATDEDLNEKFGNAKLDQTFEVPAGQSKSVFWKLSVPDYVGVLTWKAVGATETLSDGEEGLLPVLSKRILVVESLPLPIRGNETKKFTFDRLKMIDDSDSLQSQSLTVQMTSNPSWYAAMALPYLMEYPHQCNEQVFNRLYANALGRHIVGSSPKIKRVFDQWAGTPALDSPLEKNREIMNVMIEETPWLEDAKEESQSRRDVAILFDGNRLDNELKRASRQLAESQYSDGSWSWFPGGPANDFITLYITTGYGRMRHLGVKVDEQPALKSLNRLDGWINSRYQRFKRDETLEDNHLSSMVCLYLYGRSFFLTDRAIADQNRVAVDYFLAQAKEHWLTVGKMSQAQLAVATKRFGDKTTPQAILASLTERSKSSDELGRFWQETEERWWWYRAPIETQAMVIEAYSEVADDKQAVEDCKIWLLKQKQTQNWPTTKATADAVYALLLRGTDQLSSSKLVEVSLGGVTIDPKEVEAGTGFYSQTFAGSEVKSSMKDIVVKKSNDGIAWGNVSWKYLEDVANVEPYEGTPLQLKKALFLKKNTKEGSKITAIDGPVEVGDEVVTRVELRVDRDMEYVHLKDQRGSGTEPVNVLSRYKRQDGLWYYESTRDTASHFFIDYLPRGTYVFEYSVRVQHRGQYQSGIATLQCMYAPEFNSHSNSVEIDVE